MEWFYIIILLTYTGIILATTITTLETVIAGVGEDKLSAGDNLKQLASLGNADEYLAKEGHVGILLERKTKSKIIVV